MKFVKSMIVLCAFSATAAYAVDPEKSDVTCEQIGEKYQLTAEATERFADLKGACEGVYTVDGAQYVRVAATIRRIRGNKVTLYLPATDHTFQVTADPSGRVWVGGRKMRVRDMSARDEIGIYLSVDKFANERVDEVAFATDDSAPEEIVTHSVEEVEALPTTG